MEYRTVRRHAGALAFETHGTGPSILCLPSGGELRSQYRHLIPFLVDAGYQVTAMDIRGQGQSDAKWPSYKVADMGADAFAVMDALGIDRMIVVGASISAATAIWMADNAPDRIPAICLVAAYPNPPGWLRARILHPLILARPWGRRLYRDYYPRLYPKRRPDDYSSHERAVHAMLAEPGRLSALRQIFANTGDDWGRAVGKVRQPALITVGADDPDFDDPAGTANALAARMQAGVVQVFDGSGHNPHVDAPAQFSSVLLAFARANLEI